jgi:dienelactone hydrolase
MGQDGGFESRQTGSVGRRGFLVGAGTAAAAVGLAGYEGRARASSAAAAQAAGGGPETTRSISLFATPLQNQVALFTLEGRSDRIRCPVLGTFADRDPLAGNAKETLSRLKASTTLMTFTAVEGAGAHRQTLNRAPAETRILDWLDETLS